MFVVKSPVFVICVFLTQQVVKIISHTKLTTELIQVCFQAHVNIEDLDSLDDVEHCVIYYNQAVLLYHLKQYSTALKIMHKIFTFIEPMGKKWKCL